MEFGIRISNVSAGIPDAKALDSVFHKQNILGFRNPDHLRWGDFLLSHPILITVPRALLRPETLPVYKGKTPVPLVRGGYKLYE